MRQPPRLVAAVLVLAAALAGGSAPAAAEPPATLYRGATVIDVRSGKELHGYAILTRGERIVRVAPEAGSPRPRTPTSST